MPGVFLVTCCAAILFLRLYRQTAEAAKHSMDDSVRPLNPLPEQASALLHLGLSTNSPHIPPGHPEPADGRSLCVSSSAGLSASLPANQPALSPYLT
ncbi:hypothetical protein LZ30DRAFT_695246 [Colletotrichum cereale]|nr:hypothetical protein LZ30DRAFT_695246 [Colletotrichum cereale]